MSHEILVDIRSIDGDQAAKALADVTFLTDFGELTLSRIKVIHQDGKDPWVAYPTVDFKDRETGDYRHLEIVKPGVRLKKVISEAVLAEYAEFGVEAR